MSRNSCWAKWRRRSGCTRHSCTSPTYTGGCGIYAGGSFTRVSSLQIPESVCASCYRGKVRDTYTLRDGRLLMVATDRASAFDRHVGCIPFKGAFLTATSKYWMDIAREKLDFNTAMEESPSSSRTSSAATDVMVDPNLTVMRRVTPLPFEMVVREYMSRSKTTTSLWHAYQRGERRFCGHEVPEDRLRCRQRNGSSITQIPPCYCRDESLYVLLNMTVLHCHNS